VRFNAGVVLVAFFAVAVFVMLVTSWVQKMGLKSVGGFPLSYCSKDVQKSITVAGFNGAQYLYHSSNFTQPMYNQRDARR